MSSIFSPKAACQTPLRNISTNASDPRHKDIRTQSTPVTEVEREQIKQLIALKRVPTDEESLKNKLITLCQTRSYHLTLAEVLANEMQSDDPTEIHNAICLWNDLREQKLCSELTSSILIKQADLLAKIHNRVEQFIRSSGNCQRGEYSLGNHLGILLLCSDEQKQGLALEALKTVSLAPAIKEGLANVADLMKESLGYQLLSPENASSSELIGAQLSILALRKEKLAYFPMQRSDLQKNGAQWAQHLLCLAEQRKIPLDAIKSSCRDFTAILTASALK